MGAARATGIDYVEEFAAAAGWMAAHLARAPITAPVPTCPDWTVLDLVTHLGNVYSWAATVLETGRAATGPDDAPDSDRPGGVAQWYRDRADRLHAVLRDTSEDAPSWNFAYGAGASGFWHRRMVHETLVHGVDLATAADLEERLPAKLATDGVDEALTVFLHRMHSRGHPAELVAPIVLGTLDTAQAWTVEPGVVGAEIPPQPSPSRAEGASRPEPRVLPGTRSGTDVVEAPAAVLLKLLWKRTRLTDPQVRISGDEERVHRFLASRLTA